MAYNENPGFRLGDRQEGLTKEHFGFSQAAARVEADSHLDEDSAAIVERDSANTQNIRPNDFVTTDDKPFHTGTITGTVTADAGGAPVEDAVVAVTGTTHSTLTAADGTYSLSVDAGTYTVTASADTFVDGEETGVAVVVGETTADVDFALVAA